MITWWSDKSIEVVEIDGKYIALSGWNGERYLDCWEVGEVKLDKAFDIKESGIQVRCIYVEYDEESDCCDIIGYEII